MDADATALPGALLDLPDLLARCGNDVPLAQELLAVYETIGADAMRRLSVAIAVGDRDDGSMASHSLAGTFANIGAAAPSASARQLRVTISAGRFDEARNRFDEMAAQVAVLDDEVRAALRRLQAMPGVTP